MYTVPALGNQKVSSSGNVVCMLSISADSLLRAPSLVTSYRTGWLPVRMYASVFTLLLRMRCAKQ